MSKTAAILDFWVKREMSLKFHFYHVISLCLGLGILPRNSNQTTPQNIDEDADLIIGFTTGIEFAGCFVERFNRKRNLRFSALLSGRNYGKLFLYLNCCLFVG